MAHKIPSKIMAMPIKFLQSVLLFLKCCLIFVVGNIMKPIPCMKPLIVKGINHVASMVMPIGNYWDSLFKRPMMKTVWRCGLLEIYKTSVVGETAPNTRLIAVDGGQEVRLLDLVDDPRLLIVILGSWSCPIFYARLNELRQIHSTYSSVADIVFVYVEEAHPTDGWCFKNNIEIATHKTIQDRINACNLCRYSLLDKDIPLYVDPMNNETCEAYAGDPNRILLIQGTELIYQNGRGPTHFFFDGLVEKLDELTQLTKLQTNV